MFHKEQQQIEGKIKAYFADQEIPVESLVWKPIPFSGEWGLSTSFFGTAAAEARQGKKIIVAQRAQEIAELARDVILDLSKASLNGDGRVDNFTGIQRVQAVNGYLNLYFDTQEYTRRVVDTVLEQKNRFGSTPSTGQRVMIEFSHPNTHKAFHVGHLRGTILGDALCRMLEFAGYEVVRANYPGDMGMHVIKWLWGYLKFHNGEKPSSDITKWMGDVYAEAARKIEQDPDLEGELRALYARWDQREPEIVQLWEQTREWSLEGFRQMYAALDIRFDVYYFNTQEEQPGKKMVAELVGARHCHRRTFTGRGGGCKN